MDAAYRPDPVRLIIGVLAARAELLAEARRRLEQRYGPADLVGEIMDFPFTRFYDAEMGGPPLRQMLSFERLIDPGELAAIKQWTNDLERVFAREFPISSGATSQDGTTDAPLARSVNLDPGYVTDWKLVLATKRDRPHRVYLGGGIYGEVTLRHGQGQWTAQPWTYPDYASGRYDDFLSQARELLLRAIGSMR